MTDVKQVANEEHNFKFYCQSENFAKIIGNRKLIFGTWGLFGYIAQFILIVSVINVYSDADRHNKCGVAEIDNDLDIEKRSELFDMPLKLMGAYHIIEWVRMTIFLVTLLLGQNFIPLWYLTSLNTLFGIAAYITVHVVRFSENGKACSDGEDRQKFRGAMLLAEVIIFWVTFHIMSVPQIFIAMMSKENLESALVEEDEEGEEGEGKE